MNNNILETKCQFNHAFDNSESNELDKLARKVNNKNARSHKNIFSDKFSGIVCDQLDCTPHASQIIPNNLQSFFSAQGDYSPMYAPVNAPILSQNESLKKNISSNSSFMKELDSSFNDSTENMSYKTHHNKKVFSESDSFQSLSSDQFDETSLSSAYSSLPLKIKKKLKMTTTHFKNREKKEDSDTEDIKHIKSCNDCRTKLISLLSQANLFQQNVEQHNNSKQIQIQKSSNTFLNLTNPSLNDILVLIVIGIIIIMIIDIFIKQ